MKVCDLPESTIKTGLRIKSLKRERWGTVYVDDSPTARDCNCCVFWDAFESELAEWGGAWPDNDCECEVFLDANGNPVIDISRIPKE